MTALQRKLYRDLWHLRAQVLAIALVVGGGVAVCLMSLVSYSSLLETREQYYARYQFADVFVNLTRAPQRLAADAAALPGVRRVEDRVFAAVRVEMPEFDDPVTGRILSVPDQGRPALNDLFLRQGRFPNPRRSDEVIVIGGFAEAWGLAIDDTLALIVHGRKTRVRVVGIAEAPEFIYSLPPGALLPDYRRNAVLWMARSALERAVDMDGAFNELLVMLQPGTAADDVVMRLDQLFRRYGSTGAYSRAEQSSHRFLDEELAQLRTLAAVFPVVFMAVAMFLINVVISRLVGTQRDVIAILKAFGYRNAEVGMHFAGLVLVIATLGIFLGLLGGIALGQVIGTLYMQYFRFPELLFVVPLPWLALVAGITLMASLSGAASAVWGAVRLAPAEAMRPEAPPRYRRGLPDRLAAVAGVGQGSRMILRQLERRPLRTLLSVAGVAMATAIVVLGTFQFDSVGLMVHAQFERVQRQDLTVALVEPRAPHAAHELARVPGVALVEAGMSVPVRLHNGHRRWRTVLEGIPHHSRTQQPVDTELQPVAVPVDGLLLTAYLADQLRVGPGDAVRVEFLDGSGHMVDVPVAAVSTEFLGVAARMGLPAFTRLAGRGERINQLWLSVTPAAMPGILDELARRPLVAGVTRRDVMVSSFNETLARTFLTFTFFIAVLGGLIAFGVIYNTIRIALAERGRELASLRVLGYHPREVNHILLGEVALLVLLGIPLGWLMGKYLSVLLITLMQSELFRVPLLLTPRALGISGTVVIVSALASGAMAARRVARLDLIAVLKTRE